MSQVRINVFFTLPLILLLGCSDGEDICSETYPNGQVKFEVPCDSWTGTYNGQMRSYDPEGRLVQRSLYVDDILEDSVIDYFPETGLMQEVTMMRNGKKEGFSTLFYPDGITPYIECEYYRGIRFGKFRRFRPDGSSLAAFTFAYGKRHGGFAVFRSSGIPYFTGEFINDQLDRQLKIFNEEGAIIDTKLWTPGPEQNPAELVYQSTLYVDIPNEGQAFIKGDSVWLQLD
jgi:antitoxin component YwqK of YwqJK toxin-antitoxin module